MLITDRQTDIRMDRWTTVKQYAPYLSIRGHKKQQPQDAQLNNNKSA